MTELATYEPNAIAQQQATMQTQAVARLADWAQSAQAAHSVATSLVQTSFVPEQFRNKPHEATAAILAGAEVGLSPMASLKSFDIIQGTAAPRALTLRAIVQSQGHEMLMDESTATRCKMRGKRRGSSEWVNVVWTMDRAKALGVTNKANWQKQPQAMLVARASGELARLIAADAILGIGYSIEEIADGFSDDTQIVESKPTTAKRTMKRKPPTEVESESEPTEVEAEIVNAPAGTDALRTEDQSKKMFAQFGELGITERDHYSRYIGKVLGYEKESSKELTITEASQVIEAQAVDLDAGVVVAEVLGAEDAEA